MEIGYIGIYVLLLFIAIIILIILLVVFEKKKQMIRRYQNILNKLKMADLRIIN
jgi:hypothetical protein